MKPNSPEQIWSLCVPEPNTGCWLWLAGDDGDGYGIFRVRMKMHRTHRLAFELTKGPIPSGMVVRHKCDQPACINPDHLELGTNADNVDDRTKRNRAARGHRNGKYTKPDRTPRGERHGNTRLTWEQVTEMRRLWKEGVAQRELCRRFGMSIGSVRNIVHEVHWRAPS